MRSIEDILESCSDALFPAELGQHPVRIDSTDSDGDTPLHVLLHRGDVAAALALIAAGAPVNAVGDMGETPLHIAVRKELLPVIEALLTAGAHPGIRSEFGETPADQAAQKRGAIARAFRQAPTRPAPSTRRR